MTIVVSKTSVQCIIFNLSLGWELGWELIIISLLYHQLVIVRETYENKLTKLLTKNYSPICL